MPSTEIHAIRPKPGHILVRPLRPSKYVSIVLNIIEVVDKPLPGTIKAWVLRFGDMKSWAAAGFDVGDLIDITPHAGGLIPQENADTELMVIPIEHVNGVWINDKDQDFKTFFSTNNFNDIEEARLKFYDPA
jgi:hypothetical protein